MISRFCFCRDLAVAATLLLLLPLFHSSLLRRSNCFLVVNGLILPPKDKIAMGKLGDLKQDCFDTAAKAEAVRGFELHAVEEYQLATSFF